MGRPVRPSVRSATGASTSPRMPCSGLQRARSRTSLDAASISSVWRRCLVTPVWFVTRPIFRPRRDLNCSFARTSTPHCTGSLMVSCLIHRFDVAASHFCLNEMVEVEAALGKDGQAGVHGSLIVLLPSVRHYLLECNLHAERRPVRPVGGHCLHH